MKQIEVFKTSVYAEAEAAKIINFLLKRFPHYKINFDLDDCDHILRIETINSYINKKEIEQMVIRQGYDCCRLT